MAESLDNLFNQINLSKISILLDIIRNTIKKNDLNYIQTRYEDSATNFDSVLKFLIDLKVIKLNGATLSLNSNLLESQNISDVRLFIINQLLSKRGRYYREINEFFSKFVILDEYFTYEPSLKNRLKYSGLRNLLINLEVIDAENGRYSIYQHYFTKVMEMIIKSFSLSELKKKLDENNKIGLKVERIVFKLEKEKFSDNPGLCKKIEHTSLTNCAAGFDILSFVSKTNQAPFKRKFIEVKAVSADDYTFFLTKSEYEIAKSLRNRYYIYLVKIKSNGERVLIEEIQDPLANIFQNDKGWEYSTELYRVKKI